MTDTAPRSASPSGDLTKSPTFISQYFDALQDTQLEHTRELNRQGADIEALKTLLAVHGKNIDETLTQAQTLFDLRTQMIDADYNRLAVQFREVSAAFQQSIERLNDAIDDRFLRFEKKIDSIHQADSTIQAARITRTQAVVIAVIVLAGTIVTSLTTALVTLANHGVK